MTKVTSAATIAEEKRTAFSKAGLDHSQAIAALHAVEQEAAGALGAEPEERGRLATAIAQASGRARLAEVVLERSRDEFSQAEAAAAEQKQADEFEVRMHPIRAMFNQRAEIVARIDMALKSLHGECVSLPAVTRAID